MKNIAVIMDIAPDAGGKEHMAISICNHLKAIDKFNFIYVSTFKETKKRIDNKLKIKSLLFDKNNFINRILNRLKKKIPLLPFNFPFLKFLKKNNIDLVFFLDSSPLINSINKINFIYTILDIGHRDLKNLPEYKRNTVHNRDNDYFLAGKYASRIIVGAKKIKKEISKIYNINEKKISELKFPPPITSIQDFNISELDKSIFRIGQKGNYMLYPAQFWSHKNHLYLVNAIENIKKQKKLNFNIIFTGNDKGNLLNIKNAIKEKNLNENFIIYNYIKDEELFYLYKNCLGVIIPTLVAPHTFPLYEAFFFRKPVIYNTNILDDDLRSKVIDLNVEKIEDLNRAIEKLKDRDFIENLIRDNFNYYHTIFNINKNKKLISEILEKCLNEQAI